MELHPLSPLLRQRLTSEGLDPGNVEDLVMRTVREDLGGGEDVTSRACISPSQRSVATFGSRGSGCVAGIDVARAVVEVVCGTSDIEFDVLALDGADVVPGTVIARVEASTLSLLTAERSTLNLLCHLSGIATATARWVDAVAGTGAVIRDTRKTTPGLRALEKYAVRCGGGVNHRMSLSDAALVKDNHIAAANGVAQAFTLVHRYARDLPIEIEVDTLDQLRGALDAGAHLVLLDNMSLGNLREAVEIGRQHEKSTGTSVLFEASGGLALATARAVADCGVHFISVGALTHSSPILDIGLDFESAT